MKRINIISSIALIILAIMITYQGLQRDTIINPPTITGVGFVVIAIVFFLSGKKEK
ncbi:MAG: hypothetical protein AAF688_15565 [Bacteroidota bacterium]